MTNLELLKKYAKYMDEKDYVELKKDLKLLNSYREHTEIDKFGVCCIEGTFFIHDDCDDFDYFKKNESLKRGRNDEENLNQH